PSRAVGTTRPSSEDDFAGCGHRLRRLRPYRCQVDPSLSAAWCSGFARSLFPSSSFPASYRGSAGRARRTAAAPALHRVPHCPDHGAQPGHRQSHSSPSRPEPYTRSGTGCSVDSQGSTGVVIDGNMNVFPTAVQRATAASRSCPASMPLAPSPSCAPRWLITPAWALLSVAYSPTMVTATVLALFTPP